jgi:PadR family transcriptional regulator PadR
MDVWSALVEVSSADRRALAPRQGTEPPAYLQTVYFQRGDIPRCSRQVDDGDPEAASLGTHCDQACYYAALHIDYLHMDLLQGTLDMLVLRTLGLAPLHGYGIAKALRSNSSEALTIEFGSLYPALKRLELKGWITAKWETSEHNRRAKFYRLTPAGRKHLQREHSKWAEFVSAVGQVMGPISEGG